MKELKMKTHIIKINNERYLLVFNESLFNSPSNDDIMKAKYIAKNLNLDPEYNVIYDLLIKNGHNNYVFNRLYIATNKYKFKDLSYLKDKYSKEVLLDILRQCNNWWIENYDFTNVFTVTDRMVKEMIENNNLKISWC